jgi:hypothetical protein
MKIPFIQGSEIKEYVSGIDAALDIDNVKSSVEQAMSDVEYIIGKETAQLAVSHYYSGNFDRPEQIDAHFLLMDKFTHLYRAAVASKSLFHHFIWLEISVNNHGVTTVKSDRETTAYKYQKQEAKEALLEQHNKGVSRLVDFLNEKATPFGSWSANTEFKADELIRHEGVFYTANAAFMSGDFFNLSNWTVTPLTDIDFWQWSVSPQKVNSENLLFAGYKDFNQHFDIDDSATFFVRAHQIIRQNYNRHVVSRFGEDVPDTYVDNIKAAIAHFTIADAIVKMDFNYLPKSIRGPINNEMNKKGGDVDYVRDKLRNRIVEDAEDFLKAVDMGREAENSNLDEDPAPYDKFNVEQSADKKYYSSI